MNLELTFGNDPIHKPSIHAFLEATLRQFDFQSVARQRLSAFLESAVDEAISSAYQDGESGVIKISFLEEHGKLEIRIRDFGIPKDVDSMERSIQQSLQTQNGQTNYLDADVVDEVHWLNFGPNGKSLQLVKWLHETHIEAGSDAKPISSSNPQVPLALEQHYAVRRMKADEAEQVSQLMYLIYGNTYFNEDVYYPERVAAENSRGTVASYVAVNQKDQVVGHYALVRESEGPVAEAGQAVVAPAHRGRGLLGQMKELALSDASHSDLMGWYADAVTVHTHTQKSNLAYGGKLTAVNLAIAPKKEHFDSNQEQTQRITCLMYFHWLQSVQPSRLYPPAQHLEVLEEIYQRLACSPEFLGGNHPTGMGSLEVKITNGAARANIYCKTLGKNSLHQIRQVRRRLVEQTGIAVVFLDLPLTDPACPHLVSELESEGFGFLGVAPSFSNQGDLLRLAYLVEPLTREAIKTVDETAGRLVDYAIAEQKRVSGLIA